MKTQQARQQRQDAESILADTFAQHRIDSDTVSVLRDQFDNPTIIAGGVNFLFALQSHILDNKELLQLLKENSSELLTERQEHVDFDEGEGEDSFKQQIIMAGDQEWIPTKEEELALAYAYKTLSDLGEKTFDISEVSRVISEIGIEMPSQEFAHCQMVFRVAYVTLLNHYDIDE